MGALSYQADYFVVKKIFDITKYVYKSFVKVNHWLWFYTQDTSINTHTVHACVLLVILQLYLQPSE